MADLYLDNDHDVTLTGARKGSAGDYFGGTATVTWELLDAAGIRVATGATGSLAYTAASSGNFAGVIDRAYTAATVLAANRPYTVRIVASQDGYDGQWDLEYIARPRRR